MRLFLACTEVYNAVRRIQQPRIVVKFIRVTHTHQRLSGLKRMCHDVIRSACSSPLDRRHSILVILRPIVALAAFFGLRRELEFAVGLVLHAVVQAHDQHDRVCLGVLLPNSAIPYAPVQRATIAHDVKV